MGDHGFKSAQAKKKKKSLQDSLSMEKDLMWWQAPLIPEIAGNLK
jgi:hypothetical protein